MTELHAPRNTGQAVVTEGKVINDCIWQDASTPESAIDSFLKFFPGLVL